MIVLATATMIWLGYGTGQDVCAFKHDKVKHEYKFENVSHEFQWLSIRDDDGKLMIRQFMPANGGVGWADETQWGGIKPEWFNNFRHWSCSTEYPQ